MAPETDSEERIYTPRLKRAPTRPPSTPVSMPRRLGPYRLCMEIGSGGMSTVYLARVERGAGIRGFVALKRLRPHMLEVPTVAEMFFDEVTIASQVHHANVCSVLDFDAEPESHYLVMDYLMGEPLSELREALASASEHLGPIRRAELVARIIADACEGLHAAHELQDLAGHPLNVVHRDISPENIFLTYDGTAKIVDFGVACAAHQKHETRAGVVKGKLAYLAPEVVNGKRPDRRADIWGMGVVLWELLTMQRLFRREADIETLCAVRAETVPPPSQVCPGLPVELDAIVLRALSRDLDGRFPTARELGRALVGALAQRGSAVGSAEIAEAMDELFPGNRAHKLQILEAASQIDDEDEPPPAPTPERVGEQASASSLRTGVNAGSLELHTGDFVCDAPRAPRAPSRTHLVAGATLLLTACFTYSLWPGPGTRRVDASPVAGAAAPAPMLVEPAPVSEPDVCAQTQDPATTVVLTQGTYVLEIHSLDPGDRQVLRLDVRGGQP